MCGIAGLLAKNSDPRIIQEMTKALIHRGPDALGIFQENGIALGHRRLSIIDLDPRSNQPFHDYTKRYTMVFNGEVYNFKEIAKELNDYPFSTQSDTEVILAAYIKWGPNCLQRFNGMFALAIWDSKKEELFLARDRVGIKPLYYYKSGQEFYFASEIRAILASGAIPKKVNQNSIINYLQYQSVNRHQSIIENIQSIPPGHFAYIRKEKFQLKRYWKVDFTELPNNKSFIKEKIKKLLIKAIERRLISDVPLGAFLSGGIDSSAIVGLMSQINSERIHSFSVVFAEKEFDESYYSNLIANKYNTIHTPIPVQVNDFLDALPDALSALDSPSSDGINSYVISKVVKDAGLKVALSGLGGDELFAGYPYFKQMERFEKASLFWKLPSSLRYPIAQGVSFGLAPHRRARLIELLSARYEQDIISTVYPHLRKLLSDSQASSVFSPSWEKDLLQKEIIQEISGFQSFPSLSKISLAEIHTYTRATLLNDTDQMSMAHALEIRVPFFDHELIEFVLNIPDQIKRPMYPKQLLVESIHPTLPNEVVHRPKKGFVFPWENWIRSDLKDFAELRIQAIAERQWFNSKQILQLWDSFQRKDPSIQWPNIWTLVVLEEWLQNQGI